MPDAKPALRVIVYGAEVGPGPQVIGALREAGSVFGLTSATMDGAALFALKRLAGGGPAQAVDLGNATNVRVATRKLSKALGGMDVGIVLLAALPEASPGAGLPDAGAALIGVVTGELKRASQPRLVLIGAGGLALTGAAPAVPTHVLLEADPSARLLALLRDDPAR